MIHVYRVIKYTDTFLFNINTRNTPDTPEMRNLLKGFEQARASISAFDCDYYKYVNNEQDARKLEKQIQDYFHLPNIKLLLTMGTVAIPKEHQKAVTMEIEEYISSHFRHLNIILSQNTIWGDHITNKILIGDLLIRRGVSFYIEFSQQGFAIIRFYVNNRFERSGKVLSNSLQQIVSQFSFDEWQQYKNFISLSSEQIFNLVKNGFLDKLPEYVINKYGFEKRLSYSHELDFETWLWAYDMPIRIELGKEQMVSLSSVLAERESKNRQKCDAGLYYVPDGFWSFFVIQPSNQLDNITGMNDNIREDIPNYIIKTLGEFAPDLQLKIYNYFYDYSIDSTDILQSVKTALRQYSNHRLVFIIISPPVDNVKLLDLQEYTWKLTKELRHLDSLLGYTSTIEWLSILEEYKRPKKETTKRQYYTIENSLLKSLTSLGSIPWRVHKIKFSDDYLANNTCFIGIDVNIKKQPARVGGVIFDKYGVLCGYHAIRINRPHGDDISPTEISSLIGKLISYYKELYKSNPAHIIIHRDGVIRHEYELEIAKIIEQEGIKVDFIEIPKGEHRTPKLYQEHNLEGTPSRDIAIGNEQTGEAYLINNFVLKENDKYPAPDPIIIRHVYGDTPLKILAGQVYALSHANYNNYRRTNRLPITIFYADALVDNLSMKNKNELGDVVKPGDKIAWL